MIKSMQRKMKGTWRQRFEQQVRTCLKKSPERLVITCDDLALKHQIIPLLYEDGSIVARIPANRVPEARGTINREFWDAAGAAIQEYGLRQLVVLGHSQCSYFPTPLQHQMARLAWDDHLEFEFSLAEQVRQVQDQLQRTQWHTAQQLEALQAAIQLRGLSRNGIQQLDLEAWYFLHESQWLLTYDNKTQQFLPLNPTGA